MRSIVMACAGMLVPITASVAETDTVTGSVVAHFETCDHFVIQTPSQYVLMQWSNGAKPGLETVITGPINRVTRTLQSVQLDQTASTSEVWIEDVFSRATIALREIKDPCQCQ